MKQPSDRVMVGRAPCILHATGRWGEMVPYWSVPLCGTVPVEMWAKIQDFQRPIRPAYPTTDLIEYQRQEIERKLSHNPSHSLVWEFNIQISVGDFGEDGAVAEFGRAIAVFGEKNIVRWTWFDIHVVAPALRAVAWFLTMIRYNPEH